MRRFKKSERGVLTIQFMIALILVMFFIISFLGLSLTLTYASLTQYLTYSAARSHFLAGDGIQKYSDKRRKLFGVAFTGSSDWFEISAARAEFNDRGGEYTHSPPPSSGRGGGARRLFYGVWVTFTSKITQFKVPFLTDTLSPGLSATIGSYLGKEVSSSDCGNFFQEVNREAPYFFRDYNGEMHQFNRDDFKFESDNGCRL